MPLSQLMSCTVARRFRLARVGVTTTVRGFSFQLAATPVVLGLAGAVGFLELLIGGLARHSGTSSPIIAEHEMVWVVVRGAGHALHPQARVAPLGGLERSPGTKLVGAPQYLQRGTPWRSWASLSWRLKSPPFGRQGKTGAGPLIVHFRTTIWTEEPLSPIAVSGASPRRSCTKSKWSSHRSYCRSVGYAHAGYTRSR